MIHHSYLNVLLGHIRLWLPLIKSYFPNRPVTRPLLILSFLVASLFISGCGSNQASAAPDQPTPVIVVVENSQSNEVDSEEPRYTVSEVVATLTSSAPLPTSQAPATPTPGPTDTPTVTATPTNTHTPAPTAIPTESPTETAEPTATVPAAAVPLGQGGGGGQANGQFQPLTAQFSAVWRLDPQDSTRAIGEVWISAFGGNGGYRFYFDGTELSSALFEYTRPLCSSQTSFLTVTSANGQSIVLEHIETPPCLSGNP